MYLIDTYRCQRLHTWKSTARSDSDNTSFWFSDIKFHIGLRTYYLDVACTVSRWQSSLKTVKYWFSLYKNHDKEEFSYPPYYFFFQILFNQQSFISRRYQKQDSAVFCGSMLQFFADKFPCIAKLMISQSYISRIFDLAEERAFLISGSAFSLLSYLLTTRKDLSKIFLQEHLELFLERIESLMYSSNLLHRR